MRHRIVVGEIPNPKAAFCLGGCLTPGARLTSHVSEAPSHGTNFLFPATFFTPCSFLRDRITFLHTREPLRLPQLPSFLRKPFSFPPIPNLWIVGRILTFAARLFERGADSVGLDFHSHPFWDKYIEYEERMEDQTRIFAILDRIYRIPMHQYARYFERYRVMAAKRPVSELAREQVITVVTQEVRQTSGFGNSSGVEFEREMRARLDAIHLEIFKRTTDETLKRWTYESEIKRPYYHVNELDEAQLDNLRKYLDFEEAQGEYARIRFLYERCLVTAANYEEFWFRYARWTMSQTWMVKEVRDEAMRNICLRACALYVPIDQPGIRLYYARFEESVDKSGTAIAIHDAILANLPGHLETIVSLAGVHRRHDGVNSAIQFLEKYISNNDFSSEIRGSLVAEMARLIWKVKGDVREARAVFELRQQWFLDSPQFWTSWLFFEMEQPTSAEQETQCYEHIKLVFDTIHTSTSVPRATFKELTAHYFTYLQERGGRDAMKEFVELDKEIGRPESVTNPSVDNVGKEAVQSAMQNGERNIESN